MTDDMAKKAADATEETQQAAEKATADVKATADKAAKGVSHDGEGRDGCRHRFRRGRDG